VTALIAGVGVVGVGIGLASRASRQSCAGLTIYFHQPYRVGEYIAIVRCGGEVKPIDLFSTSWFIPTSHAWVVPTAKPSGKSLRAGHIRQLSLNGRRGLVPTSPHRARHQYGRCWTGTRGAQSPCLRHLASLCWRIPPSTSVSVRGPQSLITGRRRGNFYQAVVEQFRAGNIQMPFHATRSTPCSIIHSERPSKHIKPAAFSRRFFLQENIHPKS